jgi:glutamyl-tRNA synthetase
MKDTIVTRFAPSPTGYLHVGGARTALYNWLFARRQSGKFILRIEDTDVERSTDDSTRGIFESLQWLGLNWDEGPYYQSKRLDIYREHLNRLYSKGWIYPAFDTKEELEAMRARAMAEKRNPIYDRSSLKLSSDEVASRIAAGDEFTWRFKVPDEGYTDVPELLMGGEENRVKNDALGDFIITRPGTQDNPGMPLYNFVCTVDDALMGVTHVIRGVEHLTNAARQVLLYHALDYSVPYFVHLPIIIPTVSPLLTPVA